MLWKACETAMAEPRHRLHIPSEYSSGGFDGLSCPCRLLRKRAGAKIWNEIRAHAQATSTNSGRLSGDSDLASGMSERHKHQSEYSGIKQYIILTHELSRPRLTREIGIVSRRRYKLLPSPGLPPWPNTSGHSPCREHLTA